MLIIEKYYYSDVVSDVTNAAQLGNFPFFIEGFEC
jgi:hypothetical protein